MPKYAVAYVVFDSTQLSIEVVEADNWKIALCLHSEVGEDAAKEFLKCNIVAEALQLARDMDSEIAILRIK